MFMTTIGRLKIIYPEISQGYIDANHNNKMDDGEMIKTMKSQPELSEILEHIVSKVRYPVDIIKTIDILDSEADRTNDLDLWDTLVKYKLRLMPIKDEIEKTK